MKLKGNQWWYVIGAIVLIAVVLYYSGVFKKDTTATKTESGKGKVVPLSTATETQNAAQ